MLNFDGFVVADFQKYERIFGSQNYGPRGLSNFGCFPRKSFTLKNSPSQTSPSLVLTFFIGFPYHTHFKVSNTIIEVSRFYFRFMQIFSCPFCVAGDTSNLLSTCLIQEMCRFSPAQMYKFMHNTDLCQKSNLE